MKSEGEGVLSGREFVPVDFAIFVEGGPLKILCPRGIPGYRTGFGVCMYLGAYLGGSGALIPEGAPEQMKFWLTEGVCREEADGEPPTWVVGAVKPRVSVGE